MVRSKNTQKSRANDNEALGLTAIGSAGGWEVAIDETTSGLSEKWFAQIEGPSVYLRFEVESPHVIDRILGFLTEQPANNKRLQNLADQVNLEMLLAKNKKESVTLARDDEFRDRYFLIVEAEARLIIRITITGTDVKSLVSALRQAKEDLVEND
jgi:hypothetical protein